MKQLSLKRFYEIILEEDKKEQILEQPKIEDSIRGSLQSLYLEDQEDPANHPNNQASPEGEMPKIVPLTQADENLLDAMEDALEVAINKSVNVVEEGINSNAETLTERTGVSQNGFEYENKVIQALKAAKAAGNIKRGAGASSNSSDADINIFGNIFNVEIKLNPEAQMGGSSVRYSKNGEIVLVQRLEEDTEDLLKNAVKKKSSNLNKLLDFISKQNPLNINQRAIKFPLSCTKDAWTKAQMSGLLIRELVPLTAEFISDHYAKKGIYYIQIGKAGLFYMKANPAKLPVPRLEGDIVVEVRTARGGSKKLSSGIRAVCGSIRAQGRLKAKNVSPFTIDDPASIQSMLLTVAKQKGLKKKQQ